MPLVSVIVPNYNHAPYLRKRIQSILNQSFQDFEIIIFDDCSTDNSLEVLEEYRLHPQVSHFVVNKNNSGSTFIQWKKGFKLAKGKFVWIAETDDYSESNFLEESIAMLTAYPSAAIVYSQSIIVDENDEFIRHNLGYTSHLDKEKWLNDYFNNGMEEIKEALAHKCTIPNVSAVLMRKSLIEFPSELSNYRYMGDWFFYFSNLKKHDVVFLHQPLNYFRRHSTSVRSKNEQNGVSELEYFRFLHHLRDSSVFSKKEIRYKLRVNLKRWVLKFFNINIKMHVQLFKTYLGFVFSAKRKVNIATD